MSETYWFEAIVVDEEMPFDRYHEDSTPYEVLANSEEHAKIAVKLALGDRYGVIEFTMKQDIPDKRTDELRQDLETELSSYGPQLNAYEVFDDAKFVLKHRSNGSEWERERFNSLTNAVEWRSDNAPESPASYQGWTDATPDTVLQRLPLQPVEDYAKK